MPVSIVVGGQFGSEGKGKTAAFFAESFNASVAVRVGGTNSGHTVVAASGEKFVFRILPTAAILPGVSCVLPAGTYFEKNVLLSEINNANLTKERLLIDQNAVLITQEMKSAEAQLRHNIGSTASGTGEAVAARISRGGEPVCFAKDDVDLKPFVRDTKEFLRTALDRCAHVLIEGTQGYGLSVLHTPYYPYATSRDTTAAGFLSEAGLSPLDVENVIMVIRAFPIRVAGRSGPLPQEIDWETVRAESGSAQDLTERTTVTGNIRRIARFDAEIVKQAICANRPNIIVLNHCDYFDRSVYEGTTLSDTVKSRVRQIESGIGRRIDFIGTGEAVLVPREEV